MANLDEIDPFAAVGGGVRTADGKGWVPRPTAPKGTADPGVPNVEVAKTATAPPAGASPDPFASMGGGVFVNGGWVPPGHPLANQAGAGQQSGLNSAPAVAGSPQPANVPYGTPATGAPGGPAQQGQNAQTYSNDPGSIPAHYLLNQGSQDVVRNTLLQRATQPVNVDPRTNPAIRQQSDAFAFAQERARRNQVADNAEAYSARGMGGSGAQRVEDRMANEAAMRNIGGFEAELVGKELQVQRDEIKHAIDSLRASGQADQAMALEREMRTIEQQLQRLGITTSADIAGQELALKRELGLGGLNIDASRVLLADKQANNQLGFQIGDREAWYNYLALQSVLG